MVSGYIVLPLTIKFTFHTSNLGAGATSTSTGTNTKYDKTCKIICFWMLDPYLDPHLLCRSGSKEPLIMRIRADPDLHNNLQLV